MTLFCEAMGRPPPKITWTRLLKDGSYGEVLHWGPIWVFPNISRNASGKYRCKADNEFGEPVSHKVKVNVQCEYIISEVTHLYLIEQLNE